MFAKRSSCQPNHFDVGLFTLSSFMENITYISTQLFCSSARLYPGPTTPRSRADACDVSSDAPRGAC
jgi:hypothetical protein